ncbi:MAG: amidohydrolase family protein, partial [Pyrinomonadaceae bacterium]|nr:amidohydrolase family protein [Pyrinomonadaceae bacterium]
IFVADREKDIRGAVKFADEMKLKAIIYGGNEAWKAADVLKSKNVPVIITGVWSLPPRDDDDYDILYENAAKLQKAGVKFCVSTGDEGPNVRDLPYQAGMSSAFGLPKDEALKSVTLYPAQILGIANQFGSIETGKTANIVITDGDILQPRTNVLHLFINGRKIPITSRHTELYDQFKNRKTLN